MIQDNATNATMAFVAYFSQKKFLSIAILMIVSEVVFFVFF